MKSKEDREEDNAEGMFNMAVATLTSLRKILDNITYLSVSENSQEIILKFKISFVKSFFINASPLMSDKRRDEFQKKVKELKVPIRIVPIHKNGYPTGRSETRIYYDPQLDLYLDDLLVQMQHHLQERGHFMPGADESKMF